MAIKRCKESFLFADKGVPRIVNAGELVDTSDAAYKGRSHLFEDIAVTRSRPIESATAEPGAKRRLSS